MKLKLNTLAPYLALIFLGLAGSAWKYGGQFKTSAAASAVAEEKARMDKEVAEIALSSLDAMPLTKGGPAPEQKAMALANGVSAILSTATANGVKIESISSATPQKSKGQKIDAMFALVPLTGGKLHKTEITVKGSYRDLAGFKGFFAGLAAAGVSTQKLSINKSSFETTLRMFGV